MAMSNKEEAQKKYEFELGFGLTFGYSEKELDLVNFADKTLQNLAYQKQKCQKQRGQMSNRGGAEWHWHKSSGIFEGIYGG
jgi:alpha-D-ribose 1-methylphosphonate 5-triphosphate synthase subunit PhnI